MKKKSFHKLMSLALTLVLVFSLTVTATGAAADDSECVLAETNRALSDDFGVRHYGTPNEENAAIYLKEQFEKYDSFIAEVVETPLKFPGGYLYANSINRPGVVELIDGPWICGRAIPSTADFGNNSLGDFSGVFHDFGTFPNISLPDGLEGGGIFGTLRFDINAPTAANINQVITAINTKYEGNVKLTGLFIARTALVTNTTQGVPNMYAIPANITGIAVNTVGLALPCLENVVIAGNAGNIKSVFRFDPTVTYSAYATKPAPSGNPDLVIVVSSHLDAVWGAPGTNDNASGCAGLVELARRFDKVDLGNIELILVAAGGEEYGDFEGSSYMCERLVDQGKITLGILTGSAGNWRGEPGLGINFNMDMIAPALNAVTSTGGQLPTLLASNRGLVYNLAAYLLVDESASVTVPAALSGIVTNVQANNSTGVSDHHLYGYFGFDATSMNYGLERGYHTAFDNMTDNYSYDRHLYSIDLMTKAIQKAIDQELSKRAKFENKITRLETEVSLVNIDQMFKTYGAVSARFTGADSGAVYDLTFTKDDTKFSLPVLEEFVVTNVIASGNGISNMATGAISNYTSRLVSTTNVVELVKVGATAKVVPDKTGPLNTITISIIDYYSDGSSEIVAVKAFPGLGNGNIGAGRYKVEVYDDVYTVYVSTTGRDKIKDCYVE